MLGIEGKCGNNSVVVDLDFMEIVHVHTALAEIYIS
jgi:uncharacterized protein YkvS